MVPSYARPHPTATTRWPKKTNKWVLNTICLKSGYWKISLCTTCKLTRVLKFGRTTTVYTPDPGNSENIPEIINNYIPWYVDWPGNSQHPWYVTTVHVYLTTENYKKNTIDGTIPPYINWPEIHHTQFLPGHKLCHVPWPYPTATASGWTARYDQITCKNWKVGIKYI